MLKKRSKYQREKAEENRQERKKGRLGKRNEEESTSWDLRIIGERHWHWAGQWGDKLTPSALPLRQTCPSCKCSNFRQADRPHLDRLFSKREVLIKGGRETRNLELIPVLCELEHLAQSR